jgi:aldose 1-epimerase
VVLRAGGARLEVALTGATALRWFVPLLGGTWDLLDGYRNDQELLSQDGVRNGIMAPFCNRVADARYTFDGAVHDLLPGATERAVYHGLVRTEPFGLVRLDEQPDRAEAHLRCTALAAGTAVGYPFPVVVDVTYTLGPSSLDVLVSGTNLGGQPAPYTSGWHPYFRLPTAPVVDRLRLQVPATFRVRTDGHLLPLPGERAFEASRGVAWTPVGGAVVDAAFGGLTADGPARSVLTDPATGVRITVRQERGLVHVFTGDTLARDQRASIAIEPVEAMTDAFNRDDCAAVVLLEGGARRDFRFGVAVDQVTPGAVRNS